MPKSPCCAYASAKDIFAKYGVKVDAAMKRAAEIPISLHCWQGDDVGGFENLTSGAPGGGLAVTGNYPGKARTPEELRADIEQVLALVPGAHRVNLHASYAEFGAKKVDRDAIKVDHFRNWIDWAKANKVGIDFNPTFFGHEKVVDGCTLSSPDQGIRDFWVEHGKRCREISAAIGKEMGSSTLDNFWAPDGFKDTPADYLAPRRRMAESLDRVFAKKIKPELTVESVESKLFGVGCESYTVGSHEFYMGYAISRGKFICLDAGHFHPTEIISDKLSGVMDFVPGIALHVSRGVRWDSDHVVTFTDELQAIARELVWNEGLLAKARIGLDYFDASINRIAAWVIGARAARKALLQALLTPQPLIRKAEAAGDFTGRLALQEEFRLLPYEVIWRQFCESQNVLPGAEWLDVVRKYEKKILAKRA